jgi:hypothetical protein
MTTRTETMKIATDAGAPRRGPSQVGAREAAEVRLDAMPCGAGTLISESIATDVASPRSRWTMETRVPRHHTDPIDVAPQAPVDGAVGTGDGVRQAVSSNPR